MIEAQGSVGAPRGAAVRTVGLIGLPSSGKTTYIAAFWFAVASARPGSDIELADTPADLGYLNGLTDRWLSCEGADRTTAAAGQTSEIELAGIGDRRLRVVVPDYSGEFITDAWVSRRLASQVDRYLRVSDGLLVFIHPLKVTPRVTLEEANTISDVLEGGPPNPGLPSQSFDASKSPTQTILVDMIQVARRRTRRRKLPVAVIVSAWDLVSAQGDPPGRWLEKNLPLLSQFLRTNADSLPSSVFGISAQGSDWAVAQPAALETRAVVRATAVDEIGQAQPDIAAPIRWVMRSI
jgi:hypothetical protein